MNIARNQTELNTMVSSVKGLVLFYFILSGISLNEKFMHDEMEQEIKNKLGRPLSNYDRIVFEQEYQVKQTVGFLQFVFMMYYQQIRDNEIIRGVVWHR